MQCTCGYLNSCFNLSACELEPDGLPFDFNAFANCNKLFRCGRLLTLFLVVLFLLTFGCSSANNLLLMGAWCFFFFFWMFRLSNFCFILATAFTEWSSLFTEYSNPAFLSFFRFFFGFFNALSGDFLSTIFVSFVAKISSVLSSEVFFEIWGFFHSRTLFLVLHNLHEIVCNWKDSEN